MARRRVGETTVSVMHQSLRLSCFKPGEPVDDGSVQEGTSLQASRTDIRKCDPRRKVGTNKHNAVAQSVREGTLRQRKRIQTRKKAMRKTPEDRASEQWGSSWTTALEAGKLLTCKAFDGVAIDDSGRKLREWEGMKLHVVKGGRSRDGGQQELAVKREKEKKKQKKEEKKTAFAALICNDKKRRSEPKEGRERRCYLAMNEARGQDEGLQAK
ncbi:hypothetical protein Tco_1430081 [Tanacetum coccineum]